MINQYPNNRDVKIRIVEQQQTIILSTLKQTSVMLIRIAAKEESKNKAIQSIVEFEFLWESAINFLWKWKQILIKKSEQFMTDNERLNSELELLDIDFTMEYNEIISKLNNLIKKNE